MSIATARRTIRSQSRKFRRRLVVLATPEILAQCEIVYVDSHLATREFAKTWNSDDENTELAVVWPEGPEWDLDKEPTE